MNVPEPSAGSSTLSFEVPAELAGRRLDQVLAALVPARSRSQLQRLVHEGHVRVDTAPATKSSEKVRRGARLDVDLPAPAAAAPKPEALPLRIVYEDADLVVIDKAAGMVVHPAAGHREGTLVNALLHHIGGLSGVGGETRPGIVHRLDKGTSGLMVVAKHDRAHAALARQFASRTVDKEYLALVWGVVRAGRRIEDAIGRDPKDRTRMSTRARRARTAVTRVLDVESLPGVSLVRVGIATGRTHQIRVHLASIGHPVVGDALYGGVRRRLPPHLKALGSLKRPFLHAATLSFIHPTGQQRLRFESPLSEDLNAVVEALRTGTGD